MLAKDIVGLRFGRWVVLSRAENRKHGTGKVAFWNCRCDCGVEKVVCGYTLRKGTSTSCGCLTLEISRAQERIDMTGRRIGRWTVIGHAGGRSWFCRCDCGTVRPVDGGSLRNSGTMSCGCLIGETSALVRLKHGHNRRGSRSREYSIWAAMNARCHCPTNLNYLDYGGRGIAVCDRWRESFEAFLTDVGLAPSPRHSIDRIDNSQGYEPGNVRWATPKEQSRNTRRNHLLTYEGVTLPISAWAERLGVNAGTIWYRARAGLPIEKVLALPRYKRIKKRQNVVGE